MTSIRRLVGYILLLVGVVAVNGLAGCVPQITPAPAATPVTIPATVQSAPAPQALTPEETAWNAIVAAAKKEGKVTVYSAGFVGDVGPAMVDAFYGKYGIRADIITGVASGLSERVRTEQRMKVVVADVGEFTPTFGLLMLQEGQLVPMANDLPALRENVWLVLPCLDDACHVLRHNLAFGSPWVNTDLVKPDQEPKSWADILDPKWRGKILSIDPKTATTMDRTIHTLTKYNVVEAGFIPKLAAQKITIPTGVGPRPPFVALARGEGAILVVGFDSNGAPVMAEGAHIKPIAPQEGVIVGSSAIQLIRNAPHLNAGKLFINFVLSKQGHEMETRMRLVGSLRNDVPEVGVYAALKPFKIFPDTIDDEDQINKNFQNGVAAKALGVR